MCHWWRTVCHSFPESIPGWTTWTKMGENQCGWDSETWAHVCFLQMYVCNAGQDCGCFFLSLFFFFVVPFIHSNLWGVKMFARCLHFWAEILVSWDRQTPSHWLARVAHFSAGSRDAEGREERYEMLDFTIPLERRPAVQPCDDPSLPSVPLKSSRGGNAGRSR